MDFADLIWLEAKGIRAAALADGIQELALEYELGVLEHRAGFAATVISVQIEHGADVMVARACAAALARRFECRTWYFSASAGATDSLFVEALDAFGKKRWSASSDKGPSASSMRSLARRLGLASPTLDSLNYPWWRMVEDSGISIRQHVTIGIKPVLEVTSPGWKERFDVLDQLRENTRPIRQRREAEAREEVGAFMAQERSQLRERLLRIKERLGRQTVYAVAFDKNGRVVANTTEALEQALAKWKQAEPWIRKGDLQKVLVRWSPALWSFREGGSRLFVEPDEAARLCKEVFGRVAALAWTDDEFNGGVELLPGSSVRPGYAFPRRGVAWALRSALKKLSDEAALDIAVRVLCGSEKELSRLLPNPFDLHVHVAGALRDRVPRIVPRALARAEQLGRNRGALLRELAPEDLNEKQASALARNKALTARLMAALEPVRSRSRAPFEVSG